jgi:hypothetical protein
MPIRSATTISCRRILSVTLAMSLSTIARSFRSRSRFKAEWVLWAPAEWVSPGQSASLLPGRAELRAPVSSQEQFHL